VNLLDFNNRFPTEESCREYLKQKREDEGIICTCGNKTHYWIRTRELWKCSGNILGIEIYLFGILIFHSCTREL